MRRPKDASAPWTHRELVSLTTPGGEYIMINFGVVEGAINPNMLPHPKLNDTWILVAQHGKLKGFPNFSPEESFYFDELTCLANFTSPGTLQCMTPPLLLPIANAPNSHGCVGKSIWILSTNIGPHDARVVYGPEFPIIVYGEKSQYTCFSLWMQDFRVLVDWEYDTSWDRVTAVNTSGLRHAVEMQRPPPIGIVEKNYFLFWDFENQMYAHFDIAPERAFAKIENDGSVGPNLASDVSITDLECMNKYMPKTGPELEDIHQATNSLSITLCDRADPKCSPDTENTFIMTIWQWKSYHSFHGAYEPYLALFKRMAPFELYGLTTKPFWMRGRGGFGEGRLPDPNANDQIKAEWNQTEMLYVTSMAWKEPGLRYHGFLDDIIWIGFGIEDNYTAAMDVKARDLFPDLQRCQLP
ncbi:hypothetical protein EJ05DRAFT_434542 [Pseudovirgaria hyperparasitica]|uniref:Uncharacterized protein n=1 Tax=Pseudovirgaria hyperparasitica TaxID=470096 RepID=A0A6A6WJF5_9PEZI|nr:uncharacterized protein EJ05DRAFT_434542 [Pseudovirgaria hyperparasitica]KAF2762326.1 hypothetical protein EJ05DRAFT_434542 [Pseudovirgaria hyperparasitica]